jgi:AraC-like DNA-binding protein
MIQPPPKAVRSITALKKTLEAVQSANTPKTEAENGWYEEIAGCNGFRQVYDPEIAQGGIEFHELHQGLWLIIVDTKTKQVMTSQHSLGGMLVLTAVLQANIDILELENNRPENHNNEALSNGQCMIYGMETDGSFETVYAPKKTLKWVSIIIDPNYFFSATQLAINDIPEAFLNFFQQGAPLAHRNISMTNAEAQVTNQIIDCALENSYRSTFLRSKTMELLCLILTGYSNSDRKKTGAVLSAKEYARVERAKKFIEHSISDRPNIEELAYAVDLTRHKLQLGFKQLYGDTVAHIREKLRLEHALNLIRTTDMSMIQIALDTGYEHQASFTRAFKAAYGVSPIEVRRLSLSKPPKK